MRWVINKCDAYFVGDEFCLNIEGGDWCVALEGDWYNLSFEGDDYGISFTITCLI